MNTQDAFKATPMSAYDPLSRPKGSYNNVRDVSLESLQDRIQPRQVGTGLMRGTQTILNTDGSKITLGKISGTSEFGIAYYDPDDNLLSSITGTTYSFYDTNGSLIQKITGGTTYIYDITTNKNIIQIGKLPDGSYGMVVAKPDVDVADVFD